MIAVFTKFKFKDNNMHKTHTVFTLLIISNLCYGAALQLPDSFNGVKITPQSLFNLTPSATGRRTNTSHDVDE
jgi:hypothetical protein